jgi:hypothetical protein
MKKHLYLLIIFLALSYVCKAQSNTQAEFVDDGCVKVFGDLNNDGLEDYTLIVKATAKKNIVINRFNDEVDIFGGKDLEMGYLTKGIKAQNTTLHKHY